jgi:hypothetical protein
MRAALARAIKRSSLPPLFDAKNDRITRQRCVGQAFLETLLPDTKEYAIIAVRLPWLCRPRLAVI